MHQFWQRGAGTVAEVRDALAASGRDLAYTTVATLVHTAGKKLSGSVERAASVSIRTSPSVCGRFEKYGQGFGRSGLWRFVRAIALANV